MGQQAIAKRSVTQIRERYKKHISSPSRFTPNVAVERQARRAAGACLACGLIFCPGSRVEPCRVDRIKREDLPHEWV